MKKSIKVNFIMNTILTISGVLFPLITFPYISRVLNPEGIGKISFATSLISYFSLFAQLGIPFYGVRAVAQVRDNKEKLTKTVRELFFINFLLSILVYILFFVSYYFVDRINTDGSLFLILSTTIFFNMIGMEWLYKGLEEYKYITTRSLIFKIVGVALMFLFVKNSGDYLVYGFITIFAVSASSILNFINTRKYIFITKNLSNYDFKKHFRPIFIFFLLSCATTIYTNLDNILLGFIKNDEAVGFYNTAVRIKLLLISLTTSLGAVLLPRLSYYIEKEDKEKFNMLVKKSLEVILFLGFGVVGYFILFAKESIYFLAGDNFSNSILIMQIILPTVIFIGLTNLFGIQIMVPLGKEKYVLYSVIIGALFSFILNVILIVKFSFVGAAIANLVAEFAVLITQVYFVRYIIKDILKDIQIELIIVSSIVATLVSSILKLFSFNLFVTLAISSIIYFIVYCFTLRLFKVRFILDIEKQILKILRR